MLLLPISMNEDLVLVHKAKSYIQDRPKRLAQAKVQRLARATKNKKTRKRYKRNLSRGNIRPKMRRQTGLVRVVRRR
jgi:aspartate oxidase